MTNETADFPALMERLRKGDEDAAWDIVELYGPHIRVVIRRHLNRDMRRMFDSEDFVQAVWSSLIRIRPKLNRIEDAGQLVALLATVARNKVIDELRRRTKTAKYNINRQCSLEEVNGPHGGRLASNQPTPSQIAIARERWAILMDHQPTRNRRIVELRVAGATYKEIAEATKLNERTVRRIVDGLAAARSGRG